MTSMTRKTQPAWILVLVIAFMAGLRCPLHGQTPPGAVDLTFDAGDLQFLFGSPIVVTTLLQPDGKILIGGGFSSIGGVTRHGLARLNTDGSLDTTFVPPFVVAAKVPIALNLALQPDGKIVVAGSGLTMINTIDYSIVRLNPNGTLDPSFALHGMAVSRGIEGLALQPDGKILIGGDFSNIDATTIRTIARLNADGTLDTTFNIGIGELAPVGGRVVSIVLQPDGRIVAGGDFYAVAGLTTQWALARFQSTGAVDTTFAPQFLPNNQSLVKSLALLPNGQVYAAGTFQSVNGVPVKSFARINPNGTIDTAFNPIFSGVTADLNAVLPRADGKVLITGNFFMPDRVAIARVNADGSLDPFYPPNGLGPSGIGYSLALQADGKVLVGGSFFMPGGVPRRSIVRLLDTLPNVPPDAKDDAVMTAEDAAVAIGVLSNDVDLDGDLLTIVAVTAAAHGAVVDNGTGTVTYTPDPNFNGVDSFTYTIDDGHGHTDTATVTVAVIPVNDPPVAADDSFAMTANTPLAVTAPGVLANDNDIDSAALSAVLVSGPLNGLLALNADGSFSYTPAPDFVGTDTFTYRANDGMATSNLATVTISITLPGAMLVSTSTPVPGGAGFFTGFPRAPIVSGTVGTFLGLGTSGQQGIYICDRAIPTDPCRPVVNLTSIIPNGSGTFTGFGTVSSGGGSTTFIGTGSAQAGVYSCETAMPGDPCVKIADLGTAIPGGTGTFTGFVDVAEAGSATSFIASGANQSGVYGCNFGPGDPCRPLATLTSAIPGGTGTFASFAAVAMVPTRVAFIGDGFGQAGVYSCDLALPGDPCHPIANLSTAIPGGTGNFTAFSALSVTNASASNPASTRVAFIGAGNGQTGVYSCAAATPGDPCQPIANLATTIPGSTGTFSGFSAVSASGGHVAFLGQGVSGQAGIYVASTLRKVIAVGDILAGKMITELRFGRQGLDGNRLGFGATFADGSQGVFVVDLDLPTNAPPVALDDAAATNEDVPVVITVLANDSDPDGDTLTVASASPPAHGTIAIDATGVVAYTPHANYYGNDSFTYSVNDGRGGSASAIVTITTAAINDAPLAVNDSYSTLSGSPLTVAAPGVLANDSDIDSPALTAVLVTGPAQGALILDANGSFTYTPAIGFAGDVTFTYRASDGTATSNIATATIVVTSISNPTWRPTANLLQGGRAGHTATRLADGRVLVVGGFSNLTLGTSAEIYDPATDGWSPTGNLVGLGEGRANHTATLLPNGKVLVVGGVRLLGAANPTGFLSTAQLYDPATGTWTSTGSLRLSGRSGHTATLLGNGTVLVVGGFSDKTISTTAEIYDPATGTWTVTGGLVGLGEGRANHTATLLPNGKVLVAGGLRVLGSSAAAGFLRSAQLYDPVTRSWTPTGSFQISGRSGHTATRLLNGTVLVVGGYSDLTLSSTSEIYDPTTGTWRFTGILVGLGQGRANHTATLLPDGLVLVSGGIRVLGASVPTGLLATSQLYNPATGQWTMTGGLNVARGAHTASLLNDGRVLAAGGVGTSGFLSSAELYGPR